MKKYFTLFIVFISATFYAQTTGITYQAVLYNPDAVLLPGNNQNNAPLSNRNVCLKFSIIDASESLEYQETIKTTTDEFGMVNLIIGTGTPIGGYAIIYEDIVWDSSPKKLKVEVDSNGNCSQFLEISNQLFTSVPFAYKAKSAENVTGVVAIANGGTGANNVAQARKNLGIDNVDNTSDAEKPVSEATKIALNLKEDKVNKSIDFAPANVNNTKYPTTQAVKNYVDATSAAGNAALTAEINRATTAENALDTKKEDKANKSQDFAPANVNATKYPSTQAVKTYVDASAAATNAALTAEINRATAAENKKLDKILTKAETIETTATNTLAITGLQNNVTTPYELVSIDPITGVLSKINPSSVVVIKEVLLSANANDNQFSTPKSITDINKVSVYRNGVRIGCTKVDSTHIQLETGVLCDVNDEIRIVQYD